MPSGETETNSYLPGETDLAPLGSGEADSIPQPSGETKLAPKASGEAEPNSCLSSKRRYGVLIRPEVFNARWLLVPPSGVPRY